MAKKGKPNILVVLTDQQRWDTVGAYGNPMGLTPNLDRMAQTGVRFEHAFTNQPVCAPARACLQTAQYATKNGVWKNILGLLEKENSLAHCLGRTGYCTAYIGKWHLAIDKIAPGIPTDPGYVPPEYRAGFKDFWEAANILEFTSHPYSGSVYDTKGKEIKLQGYRVDAISERAVNFLRHNKNNPFLLFVSYIEPHQQNDMNRMVAPDGYAEKFRDPFVPEDLRHLKGDWQEQLPDYYGCVARIDECLGGILETLREENILENTIIVFLSDHGCHFRTRNEEYKRSCHEASIRVPLVIQGPGFNGRAVVEELVSIIDVAPTLLDAAGIDIPDTMQGRSMLPLLEGKAGSWQNEVFVQISETQVGRAIRTPGWKYCITAPDKNGFRYSASDTYIESEMYDLKSDPFELDNLIGKEEYRDTARQLRDRLIYKMIEAGEKEPSIKSS